MAHVEVTFTLEVSDPEDSTGLTEQEYNNVIAGIGHLGGYDIEIERMED